jgi:serine/threonine protein kinase
MSVSFQADKFHFNNHQGSSSIAELYSGFNLEDQSPVVLLQFNEELLSPDQLDELKRVTIILAQKEHENVMTPLAWGRISIDGEEPRSYAIFPDSGRPLSVFEHLKALPPNELLLLLRSLLRALCFAESKEVLSHQSIRPANIRIALESSELKLGFFGFPTIELRSVLAPTSNGAELMEYFPPDGPAELFSPQQYDLYALGLIALELATALPHQELLPEIERLRPERVRQVLIDQSGMPLPIQELIYKLLTPVLEQRYSSFKQALDDVQGLCGEESTSLRFTTFILDTLINGRFKLGSEINAGRVSRIYTAMDTRATEESSDDVPCVVKLLDLRAHPEMSELFHTRFKSLPALRHDNLMAVYDVGIHFESGYMAMESGLQSLEQLLIKRGTLPLPDAGRVIFQLCKALESLHFNHINYHGGIKPSNVFLTNDLRTVKLGDTLISDYFMRHGNLNNIGAEYFNPEMIRELDCDERSDLYNLGTLFFEMLVGHPPFCFKVEQEIIEEHLHLNAASRVEPALITNEVKDIILRLLEKNPAARYKGVAELIEDLTRLLGYDKKEQVEIPNLLFDFAELSMVGKNTREKSEETLAIRLPAVNNRARGVIALLIGHGKEHGDASRAAQSGLKFLRELLFHPGTFSPDLAKLQKTDPEAFLDECMDRLNQRMYREAFASGKLKAYGLSAAIGMVQENTLYLHRVGDVEQTVLVAGSIMENTLDKWTLQDEIVVGDAAQALSAEVQDRLGFGEREALAPQAPAAGRRPDAAAQPQPDPRAERERDQGAGHQRQRTGPGDRDGAQ